MWKFLLPFAAFVALVVLFAFGLNPNRDIHELPSPLIGKAAPQFELKDVLSLEGLKMDWSRRIQLEYVIANLHRMWSPTGALTALPVLLRNRSAPL